MSNTIAHRTHVHHHVPLMSVLAVIVAIAIAAAVIYAVNLPETTTTTTSTEAVYATAPTITIPEPDNPVFRHDLMRMGEHGAAAPVSHESASSGRGHHARPREHAAVRRHRRVAQLRARGDGR